MGSNIDDILDDILSDAKGLALEAVKSAAHKGQKDIMNEAKKYLDEYYAAYTPGIYKRKYVLKRAILPYWGDRSGNNGISISIGVQYNSGALAGAYRSNSKYHQSGGAWVPVPDKVRKDSKLFSSDYGTPDSEWILSNYLKGEHGGYYNDGQGTETKMDTFFDEELPNRLDSYVKESMIGAVISKI